MRKKYQSFGFAKKIGIVLLLVSVIPIFLVELLMYTLGVSAMKRQTKELIVTNLRLSANSIENLFGSYDKIIRDIYTDHTYADQLRLINVWDSKEYYIAKHKILNKLRDLSYVNEDLLGIALIAKNEEILYQDTYTRSTKESFLFDHYITSKSPFILQVIEAEDTLFSPTRYVYDAKYGGSHHLYIAHQLIDFNDYKTGTIGTVILCISEKRLRDVYYQEDNLDSNLSLLINQEGDIISMPKDVYIGVNIYEFIQKNKEDIELKEALKEFFEKTKIMGTSKLEINCENIRGGKFILANIQDLDYALQEIWKIAEIIVIVGILIAVICIVISFFFSKNMSKKVQKIINTMSKIDHESYEIQIHMEGNDEFAQISSSFNQMIDKMKIFVTKERESMIREKNAEIRSLEAQINPHFLYNTLDAINWVALDQEQFKLSKMITSLAAILRYSIHKSNEIVSLETELEYLKQYIYLQQKRFNYSFQCILEMEEELLQSMVHKLLLQPLIENAIEHAFPGKGGKDEIFIQIQKESQQLIFLIQDNGCGLSEEKVRYFNEFDYKEDKSSIHIGVSNVITRIKLYYGEQGHFRMESNENGTRIFLAIPYEQQKGGKE